MVFFHSEDVIDAANGRGLLLAYGALRVDASKDDEATLRLGHEIVSVLEQHGISCNWGKSIRERIRIAPFEWRKRRSTKAPVHERRPATTSKPASLWSRILGGSREQTGGTGFAPPARQLAEVVRAVRDESGFDLRRARRMRSAWKTLGNGGEAQVGHLGIPHVFVLAGEFTSMLPLAAAENLREQKNEIFVRGAKAKNSKA